MALKPAPVCVLQPAKTAMLMSLVDAFWLKIFPVTLGGGKRLFPDGTIPAAFKVTESTVTSKGVFIVTYERQAQSEPEVDKRSRSVGQLTLASHRECLLPVGDD